MLRVPHHTPSRYQVWALQVSLQLVVSPKGIQSLWGRGALPPAQGRSALCRLRRWSTPRLSMLRAAACADDGGESNSYVRGTRRYAWSGRPRAPQSISTGMGISFWFREHVPGTCVNRCVSLSFMFPFHVSGRAWPRLGQLL